MVLAVWMLVAGLCGCGEDPRELYETAQFEELQNNKAHARDLYEQILRGHPQSEWAEKAKIRLSEMVKE